MKMTINVNKPDWSKMEVEDGVRVVWLGFRVVEDVEAIPKKELEGVKFPGIDWRAVCSTNGALPSEYVRGLPGCLKGNENEL